jgi:hypothetical protein
MDRMGHSSTRLAMIYMHGSDAHVAGAVPASSRVDLASVGVVMTHQSHSLTCDRVIVIRESGKPR